MNAGLLTADDKTVAVQLARKAAILGRDDAFSLCWASMSLAVFAGQLDEAAALMDRALALNPNLARAWNLSAWIRIWLGQPEKGIEHVMRAMRLSPLDLAFHAMEQVAAFAYLRLDRYDDAIVWAERSVHRRPDYPDALRALAIAYALSGQLEKAQQAVQRLLKLTPGARISTNTPIQVSPEHRALFADALRKAGMPD
jgi:adenylate cyclase